jgi:hypothetical protein
MGTKMSGLSPPVIASGPRTASDGATWRANGSPRNGPRSGGALFQVSLEVGEPCEREGRSRCHRR